MAERAALDDTSPIRRIDDMLAILEDECSLAKCSPWRTPDWWEARLYACPICGTKVIAANVENHAATCPEARGHAPLAPDLCWAIAMSKHAVKPAAVPNRDIIWLRARPKVTLKKYRFLYPIEHWIEKAELEWRSTVPIWNGQVVPKMLRGIHSKNLLDRLMKYDNVNREYATSLMFFKYYNPVTCSQTGLDNFFTFQCAEDCTVTAGR